MPPQQPRSTELHLGSGNPLQVLLLTDDMTLASVIRGLFRLNRQLVEPSVMSSAGFSPEQSMTCDLIILDRNFGGRSPEWALLEIQQITSSLGARPALTIMLCESYRLHEDLAKFAQLAQQGVDHFLLKEQLSLQAILDATRIGEENGLKHPREDREDIGHRSAVDHNTFNAPFGSETEGDGFLESFNPSFASPIEDTPSAPIAESWHAHTLYVDIENETVQLKTPAPSPLFSEESEFVLSAWLGKLTAESASLFQTTLDKAINYHKLPAQVACNFLADHLTPHENAIQGQLINISTQNNGQGRVAALQATLFVEDIHEEQVQAQSALANNQPQSAKIIELSSQSDLRAEILSESSISNRDIIRSLPMTCLILDADAKIKSVVNDSLMRAGQFPYLQAGDAFDKVMSEPQIATLKEEINRSLNTGQNFQGVWSYAGDNGLRWFDTQVSKIRGSIGLERHILWTAFDISDARQSFLELAKKEDNLSQIIANSPLFFFEKDSNGHYRRANKAFCDWVNCDESALIGRRDKDIFQGELRSYLETIEKAIRVDETTVNEGNNAKSIPQIPGANYRDIKWRGKLLKYRFGEGIESLIGFGLPFANPLVSEEKSTPENASDSLEQLPASHNNITALPEGSSASEEKKAAFQGSGSLRQDFKAILSSVVNYTELAISQKNELRNQKLLEQLEALDATSARAKELINSTPDTIQVEENLHESNNLQRLTAEIIEMQRPTLPASLNFVTALESPDSKAFSSAADYQKIVMQLISSARDSSVRASAMISETATNPIQRRKIELTLRDVDINQTCAACDDSVRGAYIELAVHTDEPNMSEADLEQLIVNARAAINRSSSRASPANVIAMTHQQNGHAVIAYDHPRLALKLLFRKDSD